MAATNSDKSEPSSKRERLHLIVTNRSDLLVSKEVAHLLTVSAKKKDQVCRIVVACPDQFQAGCKVWTDPLEELSDQRVTVQVLSFTPQDNIASCHSATDQLVGALEEGGYSQVDSLLFNWHGAIPERGFEKMGDSGLVHMAHYKTMGLVALLDALLKRSLLSQGSRVVVAGSEAARGIPEMGFEVPTFDADSVDSFVALLNGSRLAHPDYNELYGHIEAIMALYIGSLARKHPEIHFQAMSPGMTADSFNWEVQLHHGIRHYITVKLIRTLFPLLLRNGIGVDYRVSAENFVQALTSTPKWEHPSGLLLGMDNKTHTWVDQSKVEGGAQLADATKQDLAFDALQSYVHKGSNAKVL